jgi:acetolactate synthase small subunit
MLLKLRAPAGPARTEVLQLAEIFRARTVDVSERCLTLCVSGDPGKVRAGGARRGLGSKGREGVRAGGALGAGGPTW